MSAPATPRTVKTFDGVTITVPLALDAAAQATLVQMRIERQTTAQRVADLMLLNLYQRSWTIAPRSLLGASHAHPLLPSEAGEVSPSHGDGGVKGRSPVAHDPSVRADADTSPASPGRSDEGVASRTPVTPPALSAVEGSERSEPRDLSSGAAKPHTIFDMLAPGEHADLPDDAVRPIVDVGGQRFHLVSFVGDEKGGAAILHCEQTKMPSAELAERLIHAACDVVILSVDWSKGVNPADVLGSVLKNLASRFQANYALHMRTLAARGKPS